VNTRWLKRNFVVIIFVVVFVVLLGGIIWLEQAATARKAEVEADLSGKQEELKRLRSLDPYPSSDNIQILKRDREELQKLYGSLQKAVMQEPLEVAAMQSEIDFVDRLRKTQTELRDLANSRGVEIKQDFAFGFSRYDDIFPCRNPVLRPDECHRVLTLLAKQLAVVEKLTKLAISNGVDNIRMIRRTEVEQGVQFSSDTMPGSITEDPKARYYRLPLDIQVTCSEKALQSFLNSLSQSDWFFTVETVKIGTEIPVVRTSAPGTPPTATTAIPQYKHLLVTMRIDLVEFPSPKPRPE
jgi:Tfp pilus assembly protein PilO